MTFRHKSPQKKGDRARLERLSSSDRLIASSMDGGTFQTRIHYFFRFLGIQSEEKRIITSSW